jgi:hypothetical protein
MAVHKVIEILAQSDKGWEDAVQKAVDEASKSVKNIESVYIKEMTVDVENNKVTKYRINAKVTFRVE